MILSKKRQLINTGLDKKSKVDNLLLKVEEAQQQYETPLQATAIIPKPIEGKEGDMKLVIEGASFYLYIKLEKRWMKVQLQEVS